MESCLKAWRKLHYHATVPVRIDRLANRRLNRRAVRNPFPHVWKIIRAMSGDDAYERYLEHRRLYHAGEGGEPLDRKAFFEAELARKWNGVKRCC
jgi:uncharacterized short protein YbdD (DUF466 family)